MQTVLEVSKLPKQYGQQYTLDHVNFDQKGDILWTIGRTELAKPLFSRPLPAHSCQQRNRVCLWFIELWEWNEALRKIGTVIRNAVAYNQMTAQTSTSTTARSADCPARPAHQGKPSLCRIEQYGKKAMTFCRNGSSVWGSLLPL